MPPGIVVISPGPATVNRREKARVSWWNRAHPTPHAPAGLAEAALINRTARAEDGSHPPRERRGRPRVRHRSEEHTSELQSPDHLVCRLLLEKKNTTTTATLPMLSSARPHI